ncbi:SNase-domain-containing protein [Trametopsis cervina]|nr:SNase-domain-containing protein [Trametopsis cervina]
MFSRLFDKEPPPKPPTLIDKAARWAQAFWQLPPPVLALSSFAGGVASSIALRGMYVRFFRRIPNAGWVTPDHLAQKRLIRGKVISVGDADNFHLYHTPGFGWRGLGFRSIPTIKKDLVNETIRIRLAGVDAVEGGHFGKEKQQFYDESLAWLKSKIQNKTVYCQLIQRDRFDRVVAAVYPSAFSSETLSELMVREGWAMVYTQAGAVYDGTTKEELLQLEREARSARRGIWRNGPIFETPAAYKRRHAAGLQEAEEIDVLSSPRDADVAEGYVRRTKDLLHLNTSPRMKRYPKISLRKTTNLIASPRKKRTVR